MTRDTRTERDLAEALATLERHAPDPEAVLRAVRAAPRPGRQAPWRRGPWLLLPGQRAPWWRGPRLLLPALAAAAAAVLAITLIPGGPGRAPAPTGLPSATSVARAMLTAFDSVSGDVEYETQTGAVHGTITDVYRTWSWPAQPAPGQRQLDRTLFSGRSPASPVVKLTEDVGVSFTTPKAGVIVTTGQVTMVCFRGSGQAGCGYGHGNTLPGFWSRFTAQVSPGTDVGTGGLFNPVTLARGIASGAWRVEGRTRLDGQQAIRLSETGRGKDVLGPLPVTLWVNAQTYLPIRLVWGAASGSLTVIGFSFLPPTPASLALLQVPIPPGYPRMIPKSPKP